MVIYLADLLGSRGLWLLATKSMGYVLNSRKRVLICLVKIRLHLEMKIGLIVFLHGIS